MNSSKLVCPSPKVEKGFYLILSQEMLASCSQS